jgi:hypothetical protein
MLIACDHNGAKRPAAAKRREGMLKIYMLMVLIGTIAAMSHLYSERGSPERGV